MLKPTTNPSTVVIVVEIEIFTLVYLSTSTTAVERTPMAMTAGKI
jgi:hypothetical protein